MYFFKSALMTSASDQPFKLGCKYLEDQNKHKEAVEIYKQLYSKNKEDKLAQLGILYNQSFLSENYIELPREYVDVVVRDVRFIDAEELEADYKVTFHFEDQAKPVKTKVKKNKKRRNKKPKNPTGNPDPERWLHKYERTIYKKQAKRRKDATKGLTQGSTATVASKPTTGTITATSNALKR
ncbi:hypothetical protein MACK_003206 [Theileria orientalis]|uniref:Signal recognition particle SRP72 subunit RNA-binding domain-containing protein n=1 Tax=Theileria orientalis TaxID=68886 RepID=A0A976SI91_THEOR|nr:hypothetical protein MACK_003206 [Theileria orientalis]